MTVRIQTQILEKTLKLLKPGETADIGVLPTGGGMTLQAAGGGTDDRYLSGSARKHLTLQLLCKDAQKNAYDRLAAAGEKLEATRDFPSIDGARILLYEVESEPQFVALESVGGPVIYSLIVYVYYHT